MKLDAKEFSLAALRTLSIVEQDKLVKSFEEAGKNASALKKDHTQSAPVIGKLACILEERLNRGIAAGAIAPNTGLSDFYKTTYGVRPSTHVLTLKNAFGAFVQKELVSEQDYDLNSGNCLELAGRILTAVKGDLTHEAVTKAAVQLKERGKDAAKNLRAILASVKPTEKMDPKTAIETFEAICADGHFSLVVTHAPDVFEKCPPETQKEIYTAFIQSLERMETILGPDRITAIATEMSAAIAPVKHVIAPTPMAVAA